MDYHARMKPTPPDWPRLSATVFYDDPRGAIDWLCRAFGFSVRLIVPGPNDTIAHSELEFGEALVMVAGVNYEASQDQAWRMKFASPAIAGDRVTQSLCMHIDDADAHCQTAREAGAKILAEPTTTDYGPDYWSDRSYAVEDCGGHIWWFMQRISTKGKPA